MKNIFIILATLIISNNCLAEDIVYNWEGTQKSKITHLQFKNKTSQNDEAHMRKVIEEGSSVNFCSTEKNVLEKSINLLEKDTDCKIVSKQISKNSAKVHAICEDQELKLDLSKKNNDLISGTNIGSSDNEEFNVLVKSEMTIKKKGKCEEIN